MCPELFVTENGEVFLHGIRPKHQVINTGYALVSVRVTGKPVNYRVHRLVASAYCDGFDPRLSVNHKDGNKLNNHYSNLEWVTLAENAKHAYRTGLYKQIGEDCHFSKLSGADVQQIRGKLNDGCSQEELSKQYGISKSAISSIKVGRRWRSIPSEYAFEAASGAGGRKLTSCDVEEIRRQIAEGVTDQQISLKYAVGAQAIGRIRRGTSWKKQIQAKEGK